MVTSLGFAIAPAFVTSLFAFSIRIEFGHGILVWIVMLFITTLGAMHSLVLKEPEHDWRNVS